MSKPSIYRFRQQPVQDITDNQQFEMNYNIALNANPWLSHAPETLTQLAMSGMDPESLVSQAGAMSGMAHLNELQDSLETLTPSGQRSMYYNLTEQQQRGLAQLGFNPPGDPADPGFIGGILGSAAHVAAPVFGVVSAPVRAAAAIPIPGTDEHLFSGAMNVLNWIGDVPGHMYRTIRQMEGWQQWVALGVGVAAMAALPFAAPAILAGAASMGTLATIGTVAGVGLTAGFASTAATSMMVTSPTEWWDIANPFGTRGVMRGERIFKEDAKANARKVLGGVPHLDSMARDIAANLDVYDLAEQFAGRRDASSVEVMTNAIAKVTEGMADPGTPEYEAIFSGLATLVEQPEFREAIDTLQSGKISFGRDVANTVGLQPGDFGQGVVSGAADALMLMSVDPMLMFGHFGKISRITRHGIPIPDSEEGLIRLSEMIQRDDRVGATVDQVMGAVVNDDWRSMPKTWRGIYDDMADWRRAKMAEGGTFESREDFIEWITTGTNFKKVLSGKATIQGQERLIFNTTNRSQGWGQFSSALRSFGAGLDDQGLRKLMDINASRFGIADELEEVLPSHWDDIPTGTVWTPIDDANAFDVRETLSYKTGAVVGRAMVRVPGGHGAAALIGNLTTMIPPGKGIALVGEGSEENIARFVDTFGRHLNMPSFARDKWLNTVMAQGSISERRAALTSFMDSGFTAAGMRTSDTLSRQVDAILGKIDQAYALGGFDSMPMGTLEGMSVTDAGGLIDFQNSINKTIGVYPVQHQAVYMVMPELRDMAKMVYNGRVLKRIARLTDADLATQAMSRYIKPGWLLRLGFIPRAAGEEALAWMMRVSEGGIMQEFGARTLGSRNAYREARTALETVGRKNMTPEQIRALDYQVASHLKPLASMMRRNGNLLPDDHMLVRWSDMMRDITARGLDIGMARKPAIIDQLEAMNFADLPRSAQTKLATWQAWDVFRYGKEHSIRRMLLNGVDPDLTEAAQLWVMRHSDAIMKSTSSMNSSAFERQIVNPDKEIQTIPNAREMGQDQNRIVMVSGERTRIRPNDIYFDTATHHQIEQPFHDDIVGKVFSEEYLKYHNEAEMGHYGLPNMLETLQASRKVTSSSGKRLIHELLQYRADNAAGMTENLFEIAKDTSNPVVEMVATAAQRAHNRGEFTTAELLNQLRIVDAEWAAKPEYNVVADIGGGLLAQTGPVPHTKNVQLELEHMAPIIEGLDALTPSQRAYAATQITMDSMREGGFFDLPMLQATIDGSNNIYSEPSFKLYRGLKDRSTIEVLPDGTLRMHGSPHSEWGNDMNISTAIEWEHSMSYAVHPQAFTGHSTRGYGALIEFDGDYGLDLMGTTRDEVFANPILYTNADADRGRGAYLIGAGSVDETEVAMFLGQGTGQTSKGLLEDFQPEDIDVLDDVAKVLTSEEAKELRWAQLQVTHYDDQLNVLSETERDAWDTYHQMEKHGYEPDDYDPDTGELIGHEWVGSDPTTFYNQRRTELQEQLDDASAKLEGLVTQYNLAHGADVERLNPELDRLRAKIPPFGGGTSAEQALTASALLDPNVMAQRYHESALTQLLGDLEKYRNPEAAGATYIDIPAGKWKIHDSASMANLQSQSYTSTSRFAPRLHDAKFTTEWGQPLDEYWTETIGDLDKILASMDLDQREDLADFMDDFTFVAARNKSGEELRTLLETPTKKRDPITGEYLWDHDVVMDPRIVEWATSPTGEPDYPTQWEAMVAEATAANEDPLKFWRDLDDYVKNQGSSGEYNNRWKALRESFELRGQGDLPEEQLQLLGKGWSPFYEDFDSLKKGIRNRMSAELMKPENQQYTKLSDQMLQLTDGKRVAKPIQGGLARLYTPVVPQNLNPQIDQIMETQLLNHFAQVVSPTAGDEALRMLRARDLQDPRQAIGAVTGLFAEYQNAGLYGPARLRDFGKKWSMNIPVVGQSDAATVNAFWDDLDGVMDEVFMMYVDDAARKLVTEQDLRRVADPFIQALSVDERQDLMAASLMEMLKTGGGSQPASRALGTLAFEDPRYSRYITNTLSATPFDDSVRHLAIGMVDVPRQSVIGRDWKVKNVGGVQRSSPLTGALQLHPQYGPKIEIVDGSKLTEVADGAGLSPMAAWENAIDDWSSRIVDTVWSAHTRGNREVSRLLPLEQRHGVRIGRRVGDRIVEVQPGEEFVVAEDLFELSDKGKVVRPLEGMSPEFFEHVPIKGNDELMWSIIGPMIRDREEQAAGFNRVVPRTLDQKKSWISRMQPTLGVDEAAEVDQWSVLTRSRVDDIDLEPATALPNIQIAAQYKQLPNNMWDRFVRWGFDAVIGPSVDALVRKPMSFHYFAGAYKQNKAYLAWMLDPQLFNEALPREFATHIDDTVQITVLTPAQKNAVQNLAKFSYHEDLSKASDTELVRWLSSLADNDMTYATSLRSGAWELRNTAEAEVTAAMNAEGADLNQVAATREWVRRTTDHPFMADWDALNGLASNTKASLLKWQLPEHGMTSNPAERFVSAYHRLVPDEVWKGSNLELADWIKGNVPDLPTNFDEGQWNLLRAARQNLKVTMNDLNDIATLRAINNITPFLDSHEQRSMFAEYGRNFIPFWYAEENFMKRWGRTLAMDGLSGGLAVIRKAQLMYAGIKSGGVIRTDVNGKDWFVYPGSGLLAETIDKVWPGKTQLPIGVLMQASTDSLLPGINDQFGQANFSPLVAVPLNATLMMFPETQDLRRSIMGDVAMNRNVVKQFVPGVISNLWDVAFADENSSTKYSSAMMTAIAYNEANGQGLPDAATAVQADEYMDRIRNHARIIMLTQALTGYVMPGAPSAIATNEDMGSFGWLTGLGVEDPRQITTDLYRSFVSNLGVDEGTAAFLRAYPTADLEDVVNPLAFTVSGSQSVSGAPLPATAVGMKWYTENQKWIDGMPEAGAWFLPPDESDSDFDYYSYSQQLASGLRKKKSPEDFLRSIKYRQGADLYFANKDIFDATMLKVGGDKETARELESRWAMWKQDFNAAHPIFAEELQSGDAIDRRKRTIDQMRDAVGDPMAPPSPHTAGIKEMVEAYDLFTSMRIKFTLRRDEASRRKLAALKERFSDWATDWQLRYPQLQRLWSSVYEPEARLD